MAIKKILVICLTMILALSLMAGAATADETINVAVSLAASTDYYIGTVVGANVAKAFEDAGANVDIMDAGNVISTQVQQIQNAITRGDDIIYIFPIGDAAPYYETLVEARELGVTVMVSNNYPGEGAYDVYVGSEEFYMGAMMAKMVSTWINETLPEAQEVKVLILEAHYNETMARRCLGMRLIGEKFLRVADLSTMYFIKTDGDTVNYMDADGNIQVVEEPTGGLILDSEGYAILNPFYDARVTLIEESNRVSCGVMAGEAQAAIEAAITKGYDDLQIVMAYGDVGIPCSEKIIELIESGTLTNSIDQVAVFCSDATDANVEKIMESTDDSSVLRGVMAAGNLVGTLMDYAAKLVNGEEVPSFSMEPLSYVYMNAQGEKVQVFYDELEEQLTPSIEQFFQ